MDRYDVIEQIILYIRGTTGINFQMNIREVLRIYWKYRERIYEMPDHYGGDQKNDGWVVEDAIFYQVFAPTRLKDSLRKEIQNKFHDDLKGLLHIVCKEGKWGGKINEFIFIVNTFDGNLPHDSERFFETTVTNLKKKWAIEFKYQLVNSDYIKDLLSSVEDIGILKNIASSLRVKNLINTDAITESIVINIIDEISSNIHSKFISGKDYKSYDRISSVQKIKVNSLEERQEEIENMIGNLDVIDGAINSINQDILFENKFERVKNFIIEKYQQLSKIYHGIKLYDRLIEEILKHTGHRSSLELPLKLLIVYIFDKCDIFEREEVG